MRVKWRGATRLELLIGAILVAVSCASSVWAHGAGPEVAFCGDFGAAPARCQRVIARAAAHASCSGRTSAERNASCDSTAGVGDGLCDACTLTGGVTTEDEMFVLLGEYFMQ